jgi:hypothetical protein
VHSAANPSGQASARTDSLCSQDSRPPSQARKSGGSVGTLLPTWYVGRAVANGTRRTRGSAALSAAPALCAPAAARDAPRSTDASLPTTAAWEACAPLLVASALAKIDLVRIGQGVVMR